MFAPEQRHVPRIFEESGVQTDVSLCEDLVQSMLDLVWGLSRGGGRTCCRDAAVAKQSHC